MLNLILQYRMINDDILLIHILLIIECFNKIIVILMSLPNTLINLICGKKS